MKCPYCGKEMTEGKICSSEALFWKNEHDESERLNDEGTVGWLNGDRVCAYRCKDCGIILIKK